MAASSPAAVSGSPEHLCVLVHGLWGHPDHFKVLSASLREKYPSDRLHILATKTNIGHFTYDGIELGGERVANEIEGTLAELAKAGHEIKKLSVVGYSLGGLVSRYAIGLLYHKGWFNKIQPVNYTTFATPHLGVRSPLRGYTNHIWNVLGARTLSMSGRQLFGIDKFRDTNRPLLSVLADPDSIFIKALSQFQCRSLYANIINDRSATYYTTSISATDPFVNLDAIDINYLDGFGDIILDPEKPFSLKRKGSLPGFPERFLNGTKAQVSRLPLMALLGILIPIGTLVFLFNAAIQSVRSRQRIRLHEAGKAGIDVGGYRMPLELMLNNVRQEVEDMYERANQDHGQEYLLAPSEESASSMSDIESSNTISKNDALVELKHDSGSEFSTLALTPDQFAMIQALDDVGFKKYLVHIHNVRHSHAAIIVRMDKKRYHEGKAVIRHWLGEFTI